MIEQATDGELVQRIAQGDDARDAEAEFCRRFGPRIRHYGLRHLRSGERAADLVQGVLLAVLEAARAGRIVEPDQAIRFVLGTCRNMAMRMRQKEARSSELVDGTLDIGAFEPEYERIDAGALHQCLSALDARSRTVLFLSFEAENRADEIAKSIGISAGNVRIVRHRAIAQLRRCLDDAGGAES